MTSDEIPHSAAFALPKPRTSLDPPDAATKILPIDDGRRGVRISHPGGRYRRPWAAALDGGIVTIGRSSDGRSDRARLVGALVAVVLLTACGAADMPPESVTPTAAGGQKPMSLATAAPGLPTTGRPSHLTARLLILRAWRTGLNVVDGSAGQCGEQKPDRETQAA